MEWYHEVIVGLAAVYLLYLFAGVVISGYIPPCESGIWAYCKNVHLMPFIITLIFYSELTEEKPRPEGWD